MTEPQAVALMLLGPTGSGKSALALALALHVPLEIVSVDSAQVYRGLDIGSAKPSPDEREAIPHHLIDIRDPTQRYSAAEFARDAAAAIAGIRVRGRLPLLVGGTMLYAKALREGLAELPSADAGVRAELECEAAERGWPALHARLAQQDPVTAARIAPNDAQRIQRALEVIVLTGRPMSQSLATAAAVRHEGPALRVVALVPADRAALHVRIERRFDAMLAAGFLDEVRALRARGDLTPDLPALRSVGYRQAWDFLGGQGTHDAFRAAAVAATRRLAKRQLTWLRSFQLHQMMDPLAGDALPVLTAAAHEILGR